MNNNTQQAALLIDADNLSHDGMAEALAMLQSRGVDVCVRRAYGSPETLAAAREFLQAHAVRPVVNQGRGTTDAALVVDAMDLLHTGYLPALVAIGSGDGDFAPLVLRLREAGRRVICFAQAHKAPEGLDRFYADVIAVDTPNRARRAAAPAPVTAPGPVPAPVKKSATRKTTARKAAVKAAPAELTVAQRVHRALESFPGFTDGESIELNAVVKKLRDEKLMGKSTSARNFLKLHAPEVELLPLKEPNKVRLRD
jgi:hypothetical protein